MRDPATRIDLRPHGPSDPAWVGRLVGHLQNSWRTGTPILVEAYLEAIPELTSETQETAGFPALGQLVDAELAERQRLRQPLADGLLGCRLRRFVLPGFRHPDFVRPFPDPPLAFGPYDLLTRLGRGAFGVVSLARDRQLDRDVAVKQIEFTQRPNAQPIDEKALESRFKKEARAAGALHHPNLIRLNAFDELPGSVLYLDMGYEPGPSLGGYTRGGDNGPTLLPPEKAAVLVLTLARAMAYAHNFGLLHRDLKPDNIRFDRYGHPVVVDFGLARVPVPLSNASTYSQTDTVLGTFRYAAPEVYRAEYTPMGDVYSLGVVLFELLTGSAPFEGPKGLDMLVRKNREDPQFPENTGVSPVLIDVCMNALEREPQKRFQSMHAFADALGEYLSGAVLSFEVPGRSFIVMPTPKRKRRWLVPAVAACALGIGVGGGMFLPWVKEPTPTPMYVSEQSRLSPRQTTLAASRYLASLPPEKQQRTRFLILQPFDQRWISLQYRDQFLGTTKEVIKALSIDASSNVSVVPNSWESLLAFNLDEIGWIPSSWDELLKLYPYAVEYTTLPKDSEWNAGSSLLADQSQSACPIIRADWLIAVTTQSKRLELVPKLTGHDANNYSFESIKNINDYATNFLAIRMTLAIAAAELGLTDDYPLRIAIQSEKLQGPAFETLLRGGSITRQEWDDNGKPDSPFYRAIGFFKLGTAHAPP